LKDTFKQMNSMSELKMVGISFEARLESTANSTPPPIRVIRLHLYICYLQERIKCDVEGSKPGLWCWSRIYIPYRRCL